MTTAPEPLQREDILELAREKYLEARLEHGDGLAWDVNAIWDLAAENSIVPSRTDDWEDRPVPAEVMLLLAEAEEYAKT